MAERRSRSSSCHTKSDRTQISFYFPTPVSHSYYVYYRIDPPRAAAAEQRINQLLDVLAVNTGIAGRLMRKRGEPNLWMEVYENVTDEARFERQLADAVNKLDAISFLQPGTGRHVECFES